MAERTPCALVQIIDVQGSTPRHSSARMLVYDDGSIVGTVGGGRFEFELIRVAVECISTGLSRRYSAHLTRDLGMCCGGTMEAFIEPLTVTADLVIYGAGHVGRATARLASGLDFRVQLIDDRADQLALMEPSAGISLREARKLKNTGLGK